MGLAHDLIVWTQALALEGEFSKAEPKRLRYQPMHVAGRLAFSARRAKLHLQDSWPWATELVDAFKRLKRSPAHRRLTPNRRPPSIQQAPRPPAALPAAAKRHTQPPVTRQRRVPHTLPSPSTTPSPVARGPPTPSTVTLRRLLHVPGYFAMVRGLLESHGGVVREIHR